MARVRSRVSHTMCVAMGAEGPSMSCLQRGHDPCILRPRERAARSRADHQPPPASHPTAEVSHDGHADAAHGNDGAATQERAGEAEAQDTSLPQTDRHRRSHPRVRTGDTREEGRHRTTHGSDRIRSVDHQLGGGGQPKASGARVREEEVQRTNARTTVARIQCALLRGGGAVDRTRVPQRLRRYMCHAFL